MNGRSVMLSSVAGQGLVTMTGFREAMPKTLWFNKGQLLPF
jgi:hypothetical protein